jgi:hypothetical protein
MTSRLSRFALVLLGGAISLTACGHGIDGAAKADIDRRIAVMVPTGQPFPASPHPVPKPIAVGQWTQHKLVSGKGEPSLLTYKIVGEEGGAHWVEVANESYYGKTVIKILVVLSDRTNAATMEIRAVKSKDKKGQVVELQGPVVQSMRPTFQSLLNMLAVRWEALPQENVNVVAGHFSGCLKAITDASWGPWYSTSTSWMHPIVPMSGLVKSIGMSQPVTVELVGFGDLGATSEIP